MFSEPCNLGEICSFRKVMVMEDPEQNIHLKNLSLLQSNNEKDALDLLFLGEINRMIAEVSSFIDYFDIFFHNYTFYHSLD